MMDALRAATAVDSGAAVALPFHAYTDPGVFELEMERVFRGDWVAVCAEAELADPGAYVALSIGGEPVAVVRGRDGRLRALSNVCRHRGTPLLDDGVGSLQSIVCPYHAWAYADDGRFRGAPYTGSVEIDPDTHCLPNFSLEVWAGVVFVNVDGRADPLGPRLAGIAPYLAPFAIDQFDTPTEPFEPLSWEANWKLAFENGIEGYHLFSVHRETLEKAAPTRDGYYCEGSWAWTVTSGRMSGDSEAGGYLLVSIPPSFVGLLTRESWGWISVLPESLERCRVVPGALVARAVAAYAGDARSFTQAFLEEDRWICERSQRGMRARHSEGGRLVEIERVVGDFHQYLGRRLFGHGP